MLVEDSGSLLIGGCHELVRWERGFKFHHKCSLIMMILVYIYYIAFFMEAYLNGI
jgi:hypothetical protein